MSNRKGTSKHSVLGIGVADAVEDPNISTQMHKLAYMAWVHMLFRCYDPKTQARQPTYAGCSVCAAWTHFSTFRSWFVRRYKPGYQLDKDILVPGNKIYAPEFCSMVPKYINTLLLGNSSVVGAYPVGVHWNIQHKKFTARCCFVGKRVHIGCFDTPDAAAEAYRVYKAAVVREVALKAFAAGEINRKVKLALCRRKF